jgi:hypothetical protein
MHACEIHIIFFFFFRPPTVENDRFLFFVFIIALVHAPCSLHKQNIINNVQRCSNTRSARTLLMRSERMKNLLNLLCICDNNYYFINSHTLHYYSLILYCEDFLNCKTGSTCF